MREINDIRLLEKYMKKYEFQNLFSTQNLPFRLYCYEVGEFLNVMHPQEEYLKFLVQGRVAVDKIDDEGNLHRLFEESAFDFFGEAEICGHNFSNHWHEVIETAYCIELPLEPYRNVLWNDLKFMQYMVSRMSESIYVATAMMEGIRDDIESRLLTYVKNYCTDNTFTGIELTAKRIRCSKRQLLRVISRLVEEQCLEKIGRGTYRIL